jgi:predicted dehydrogenase
MRHADQHHPIALACLQAGAHLYVEKPFTPSPDLAEALCTEAERRGLKIAVAHTMRLAPAVQRLHRAIRDGLLGEIAEIRAHGKQDTRAGGEDMMVLGSHLFDLMRLFAGDPVSASARITTAGRPITRSDRRLTRDNVGWVAGDRVFASFGFDRGVIGTFTSDARLRTATGHWGMRILGSKATARILADLVPRVEIQLADATPWTPLEDVAPMTADNAQRPVVEDWLESVRGAADHVPACSGRNGAWAVRMVTATYQSALESRAVSFEGPAGAHPLDP